MPNNGWRTRTFPSRCRIQRSVGTGATMQLKVGIPN